MIALVAVLTMAVFAKSEPPDELLFYVMQQRMVHDQKCTIKHIKNVECFVFADDKQGLLWIILFDDKLEITHVYTLREKTLGQVWVRDDLTT